MINRKNTAQSTKKTRFLHFKEFLHYVGETGRPSQEVY